ncbi:C-5 cytosine-specific DNA methylase family protein [Delftia acidovorans]|uniref:DNA cytosine methyltransferase n=1 Tax=Delftia acidovorans TaxID=80866 RepID=UPI000500A4D3|nr:DNA cytosine methyltransferase [Delftia acidovorans]KFJ12986.1 C-5 cytosine-specific DNA methylase family protein [Delftia acidovorans]QQB53395.1 DNA cytosine methyltransferase [Delftia acidovorans]
MKRDNFTMPLAFPGELIIDNFAGGGGTSTGLEAAFGRPVDIAINHDPEALAMHAANHPHTLHLCESVWDVNPIQVTGNQPVALVWLSPDCKHFSKAKGGTPVSKHIRGLAWVGMRWVAMCKPRVLMLENVEEFQTWGPILVGPDGMARPDPARRGKTFQSFVRQLKAHGYQVDWRELRASDHGTPTIRKRLFLVARRDGLPIVWPEQTHAEPTDRRVIAGKLAAHRTAAECIDFDLHAESVFGRKRALVDNTMRRVAKGLWRHVLTSASPFIVGAGGPVYSGRPAPTDRPIGTVTTQNHRAVAQPVMAPVMAPMRGTSEQHLVGHAVDAPLSTVAASGTHHALVGANLVTIGYGEREGQQPRVQDIETPLGTVVAGGIKSAVVQGHLVMTNTTGHPGAAPDSPLRTVTTGGHHALVAAHLVDMGHGEGPAGGKRFSHGIRSLEVPLNTVTASGGTSALAAVHLTHLTHHGERTGNDPREPLRTVTGAHRGEQAMVAACLEQANGGFYDGDGRAVGDPMSTVTSSGTQQRLITAYLVKYYSEGGQDSACSEPMHTVPTKARMGLVQTCQVPAATLAPEHAERARLCAELLHKHLPEHFPDPAELVLMWHAGQWWVLVDITLRMLKPRELFRAQGFPRDYHFERVPDPALLFRNGKQASDPRDVPLIDLSTTAQVRMCGNSVCPPLAEALARANFAHEALIYGVAA